MGIENAAQTRQDALVKEPPAVLAPPLESIRSEVLDRFRAALAQDEDATLFANLLDGSARPFEARNPSDSLM
jgi:hypothetical protein